MPLPRPLPEPVKVSPVIKFFRYAFLITGIFYGASRRTALKAKENKARAERELHRAEMEAQLAQERQIANEQDMHKLIQDIFGIPSKKDSSENDCDNVSNDLNGKSYHDVVVKLSGLEQDTVNTNKTIARSNQEELMEYFERVDRKLIENSLELLDLEDNQVETGDLENTQTDEYFVGDLTKNPKYLEEFTKEDEKGSTIFDSGK